MIPVPTVEPSGMAQLQLYQFRYSHYSERARWCLDFKGLRYQVHSLLPGFQARRMMKLSGQRKVPVLVDDGEVVTGSAFILEHLEARHPRPALVPQEPSLAEQVGELESWFDREVGPGLRVALFSQLIEEPGYLAGLFCQGKGGVKAGLYRTAFPLMAGMMRKKMGLDDERGKRAREVVEKGLNRVAEAGEGYLFGEQFSAADLTAASLLFATILPARFPYPLPQPVAPSMRTWLDSWKEHPGAVWVDRIYREHRGVFNGFERSSLGTTTRTGDTL